MQEREVYGAICRFGRCNFRIHIGQVVGILTMELYNKMDGLMNK